MRKSQFKILLEVVNKNLKENGIGEAQSIELNNNLVYAFWDKENYLVGFLPNTKENVKNSFIYSPAFWRKF